MSWKVRSDMPVCQVMSGFSSGRSLRVGGIRIQWLQSGLFGKHLANCNGNLSNWVPIKYYTNVQPYLPLTFNWKGATCVSHTLVLYVMRASETVYFSIIIGGPTGLCTISVWSHLHSLYRAKSSCWLLPRLDLGLEWSHLKKNPSFSLHNSVRYFEHG